MEPHRVSASPSAPAAPAQRSKAPAPTRPAEGASDAPAAAGSFLSMLSALGDGAAEAALPLDATLLSQAAAQPEASMLLQATPQPDVAMLSQATTLPDATLLSQATPLLDATLLAQVKPLPDATLFSQATPLPDATLLSQATLLPDAALLSQATQLPGAALPAGAAQGSDATVLAWQRVDAWQPQTGSLTRSDGLATLSLAEVAQQAGLLGTELLGQGGLVAQTARMDAAVALPAMQGQGAAMTGYQRAFSRLQSVLSQGMQGVVGQAKAPGPLQAAADRQGAAVSLAASTAVATAPDGQEAATTGASRIFSDGAASILLQAQWLAATEPAVRPAVAPFSTEKGATAGVLGSAQGAQGEPRLEGGATTVAEPSAAGAEEAFTEQASYWVGDNLQNAELTVTHDGMPVEVSVSLSGNEAHVSFRSDESQTRDLLDSSQDQLRDMLGNEGLVLSGVSVGESGARNASGEGSTSPRGRPSGRSEVQVPGGSTEERSRPSVLTDRAVDVFV